MASVLTLCQSGDPTVHTIQSCGNGVYRRSDTPEVSENSYSSTLILIDLNYQLLFV